jgi:hypothetical protein
MVFPPPPPPAIINASTLVTPAGAIHVPEEVKDCITVELTPEATLEVPNVTGTLRLICASIMVITPPETWVV